MTDQKKKKYLNDIKTDSGMLFRESLILQTLQE